MISWFEKHNKVSWTITILIAIMIFYISSLTFSKIPSEPGKFNMKPILYHIIAFFFLAFFLLISLVQEKNKQYVLPAILISVIYGILDEIHQLFVPGRSSSTSDLLLDSLGIIFAFMLYSINLEYRYIKNNTLNNKNL